MAKCDCGTPLDENSTCSCCENKCMQCCECPEDCSCGCKGKATK
ncbi:MAG: hypothetical protein ABH837_03395 [bacterium]